eukprot:SAG11_NODE_5241_length_1619_cov_1.717105_2_plen_146_part_00
MGGGVAVWDRRCGKLSVHAILAQGLAAQPAPRDGAGGAGKTLVGTSAPKTTPTEPKTASGNRPPAKHAPSPTCPPPPAPHPAQRLAQCSGGHRGEGKPTRGQSGRRAGRTTMNTRWRRFPPSESALRDATLMPCGTAPVHSVVAR